MWKYKWLLNKIARSANNLIIWIIMRYFYLSNCQRLQIEKYQMFANVQQGKLSLKLLESNIFHILECS